MPVSRRTAGAGGNGAAVEPYWRSECGRAIVYVGDCLQVLTALDPSQFHAVCTDPPYNLSFMGCDWDSVGDGRSFQAWFRERAAAILRVAKPGAHLLCFGGTRMWHRMTCAIEDAGFDVRDTLMWLYSQGFPKGTNISKAIDRMLGAERVKTDVKTRSSKLAGVLHATNAGPGGFRFGNTWGTSEPVTDAARQWDGWNTTLKPSHEDVIVAQKPIPPEMEQDIIVGNLSRLEAQLWSLLSASAAEKCFGLAQSDYNAACASAQWSADERSNSLVALSDLTDMSQSELVVSSCLNIVILWSNTLGASSALTSTSITRMRSSTTIDWKTLRLCSSALTLPTIIKAAISQPGSWWNALPAARVLNAASKSISATQELSALATAIGEERTSHLEGDGLNLRPNYEPVILARRPPRGSVAQNTLDHGCGGVNVNGCRVGTTGADVTRPIQSKSSSGSDVYAFNSGAPGSESMRGGFTVTHKDGRWPANVLHDGSGEVEDLLPDGAARFFYTAKADEDDRPHGKGGVVHPTVKPLDLMRYLVRLVCARGSAVLDPFMGSGSTGVAAVAEGCYFVGVEQSREYADLAVGRLRLALQGAPVVDRLTPTAPQRAGGTERDAPPPPKRFGR